MIISVARPFAFVSVVIDDDDLKWNINDGDYDLNCNVSDSQQHVDVTNYYDRYVQCLDLSSQFQLALQQYRHL